MSFNENLTDLELWQLIITDEYVTVRFTKIVIVHCNITRFYFLVDLLVLRFQTLTNSIKTTQLHSMKTVYYKNKTKRNKYTHIHKSHAVLLIIICRITCLLTILNLIKSFVHYRDYINFIYVPSSPSVILCNINLFNAQVFVHYNRQ